MADERRRSPRINLLRPVPGRVGPAQQPIRVRQMSLGGMLIDTEAPLSPLGLHEFQLALDTATLARVSGHVVHSRYVVAEGTVTYTVGVEFAFLSDETAVVVRRFVTALQEGPSPAPQQAG